MSDAPSGRAWVVAGLVTAVSLTLDRWVWQQVGSPGVYDHDWGRLLRVLGSLVFWLPLSVAVWLESRRPAAWLLLAAPTVAGGVAELIKLLVRRERPGLHDGSWYFRALADRPFDTHDIGFPSSHAAVAFGGAVILSRFFPKAAPVIYLLAGACGLTRLLARAHFMSDVVAGSVAGWLVGALLWRRFVRDPAPA